jgi:hypothetical protein
MLLTVLCALVIASLVAVSGSQNASGSSGAVEPSADVSEAQRASLSPPTTYVDPWQALEPAVEAHKLQNLYDLLNYSAAVEENQRQEAAAAAKAAAKAATVKQAKLDAAATAPSSAGGDVWHALAVCETGGKMDNPNTGNGYYGYFQFSLGTWQSVGGPGYPHEHSYETQRSYAQKLQARSGWGQWPACSAKLGLR